MLTRIGLMQVALTAILIMGWPTLRAELSAMDCGQTVEGVTQQEREDAQAYCDNFVFGMPAGCDVFCVCWYTTLGTLANPTYMSCDPSGDDWPCSYDVCFYGDECCDDMSCHYGVCESLGS